MAIEPLAYREAIGRALQHLRPHLELVILAPEELEEALTRLDPDLVICDGSVSKDPEGRAAWVEYDPLGQRPATVSLEGQHTKLEGLKLEDLFSVVDKVEQLSKSSSRRDFRGAARVS